MIYIFFYFIMCVNMKVSIRIASPESTLIIWSIVNEPRCEKTGLSITVKNQQNKFKYAPRIEPNNYKYVSYFCPVAI